MEEVPTVSRCSRRLSRKRIARPRAEEGKGCPGQSTGIMRGAHREAPLAQQEPNLQTHLSFPVILSFLGFLKEPCSLSPQGLCPFCFSPWKASLPPTPLFRELVSLESTHNYLRKTLFVTDSSEFAKRLLPASLTQ